MTAVIDALPDRPVAGDLVRQVEFVPGHPVAAVAVLRQVRIDAVPRSTCRASSVPRSSTSATVQSDCPASGWTAERCRRASPARPGRRWRRRRAGGGQRDTVRSRAWRRRPSVTVSMDMIRSWNRWVCTTHPRSTVAPSPRVTRSASGSQYVSHQTPGRSSAPSPRSQTLSHRGAVRGAREPRRGDGFDERVGHLVAPDERTPQRMLDRADAADDEPLGGHR